MHTAEEWPGVEDRMFNRMRMMRSMRGMMSHDMRQIQIPSKKEKHTILGYLRLYALKPASLEALGPKDAPGLAFFQQACSLCHALPDPGLHTSDEWPVIVARMQKNMDIMGKPGINDQERDEIVGYLRLNARK